MSKRQMSRRAFLSAAGAASTGLAVLMAGCQPKVVEKIVQVTVEVEKEVERVVEVQAASDVTTVSILCRAGYGGDPVRLYCSKFANEYPGLQATTVDTAYAEIEKKAQTMFAAGNSPDVIYTAVRWFPFQASQGMYLPLDDIMDTHEQEFQLDDIFPAALETLSFEGSRYAFPEWCSPTSRPLLVYNIDLFEAAGVPLPPPVDQEFWHIDDWKEAALKLSRPEVNQFGIDPPNIANYYDWDAFVDGYGSNILVDDVGLAKKFYWLDNPQVLEAWEWYEELAIKNHAAPKRGEAIVGINMFTAGMMATTKDGHYHLPGLPEEIGDKFRYGITLFRGPKKVGSGVFCQGFSVSSQTKNPDAAAKLAYYQTSTEVGVWSALTGVGMGVQGRFSQWRDEQVLAKYPIYKQLAEVWDSGEVTPFPHPWNLRGQELLDIYGNLIDPLRFGDVSWAVQAPVIQKDCQAIMDQPRP